MRKSILFLTLPVLLLPLIAEQVHSKSRFYLQEAEQGDPAALVDVAETIMKAKPDCQSMKCFVNDQWGATLLLKYSADKGNPKAADMLKELHKTKGQTYAYLLKGLLDNCRGDSCQPFAKYDETRKSELNYTGVCAKGGDTQPNTYDNAMNFTFCIGSMADLKVSLASSIADNAMDVEPKLLTDIYFALDTDSQVKLAPAIQKNSSDLVAKRYFDDRNFSLAKFWYQKSGNQAGLAEVDKKEKEIAEFQEAKRKAEAEALAAKEEAKLKEIASEAAKKEADQKAETDKKAVEQRLVLERQSADQKLELQRRESEKQLAQEREAGKRRLSEEKATAMAEADRKQVDGLKSGSVSVANLKDAILKYDAKDGIELVQKPPLKVRDGYWFLRGALQSVEKEVPGQSGNVYVCSSALGTFAFVTDSPTSQLSINQRIGIVGRHVATNEGSSKSGTVLYIPIFNAVEVIGD